jgi:glycosyltransferase involved in cell wall biosynthesis
MPVVSVIIPMRNAEPYVRDAVESVLAQIGIELEVIVVDDGSTDRSAQIVRDIRDTRVRIIPGPQRGISASFNTGLAAATGEFLARCDADDVYPSERLTWQTEFLQDHPNIGAVCGSYATMTDRGTVVGKPKGLTTGADVTDELRRGQGRSHMCAYLFRTELVKRLNGCREFFVTAEDVDLQFRLSEITRIWQDPRPAYLYRLHDASITHVQKAGQRSFFEACARTFQQQRQERGKDHLELGSPPAVPESAGAARASARQQVQNLLLGQAWAAHRAGHKSEGFSIGLRAWLTNPRKLDVLKSLFALLVKPAPARQV